MGEEAELAQSISAGGVMATGWSPDGRFLLCTVFDTFSTRGDLRVLRSDGGKPVPLVQTTFDEGQGRFSPDGRWVAYVSNESGANEVYVRAFTADAAAGSVSAGPAMRVSRGGGTAPWWRGDGRELFYLGPDGKLMAVEVMAGQEFQVGAPSALFQTPLGTIVGDVSADGKRFLLVSPLGTGASAPFTVVLNWTAGLK